MATKFEASGVNVAVQAWHHYFAMNPCCSGETGLARGSWSLKSAVAGPTIGSNFLKGGEGDKFVLWVIGDSNGRDETSKLCSFADLFWPAG